MLKDSYNGYVETTLNKKYSDLDIDVHGGLTFGPDELASLNIKGKWYGFDTAHAFDEGIHHRDIPYMIKECESLADQLIKLEK